MTLQRQFPSLFPLPSNRSQTVRSRFIITCIPSPPSLPSLPSLPTLPTSNFEPQNPSSNTYHVPLHPYARHSGRLGKHRSRLPYSYPHRTFRGRAGEEGQLDTSSRVERDLSVRVQRVSFSRSSCLFAHRNTKHKTIRGFSP